MSEEFFNTIRDGLREALDSSLPEGPADGVAVSSSGALDLIKRVGIWGLAANEGCPCAEFSVHNVSVSISCRKSSGSDVLKDRNFAEQY